MHHGKRDKLFQNYHPLLFCATVILCIICPFYCDALHVAIFFVIVNYHVSRVYNYSHTIHPLIFHSNHSVCHVDVPLVAIQLQGYIASPQNYTIFGGQQHDTRACLQNAIGPIGDCELRLTNLKTESDSS